MLIIAAVLALPSAAAARDTTYRFKLTVDGSKQESWSDSAPLGRPYGERCPHTGATGTDSIKVRPGSGPAKFVFTSRGALRVAALGVREPRGFGDARVIRAPGTLTRTFVPGPFSDPDCQVETGHACDVRRETWSFITSFVTLFRGRATFGLQGRPPRNTTDSCPNGAGTEQFSEAVRVPLAKVRNRRLHRFSVVISGRYQIGGGPDSSSVSTGTRRLSFLFRRLG
jgi:hypothetical protein